MEDPFKKPEKNALDWTDSAYAATENNGQAVGFFCYSVNTADNIGFLKFIIVDKTKRGKGYGKEMLNLALQYAFQITGAKAPSLFHWMKLSQFLMPDLCRSRRYQTMSINRRSPQMLSSFLNFLPYQFFTCGQSNKRFSIFVY